MNDGYRMWMARIAAILLGGALIAGALIVGQGRETKAINIVILALGASCGWLVGALLSPYKDTDEKHAFPKHAAAVSAFASGWLISKLDRALEAALRPETLLTATAGFRLAGGVAAFVVALITTYIHRAY